MSVFAVLGAIVGLSLDIRQTCLLLGFPIVHFVFISSFRVRNDRMLMPLLPFLFLLASLFLYTLLEQFSSVSLTVARQGLLIGWGFLVVLGLGPSACRVIGGSIMLLREDSRTTAQKWIKSNLPPHSKIVAESYSPYLGSEYDVLGVWQITESPPEWYVTNGVDYLIFSHGMYGRFYQDPDKYEKEVAEYEAFFARFELVKDFQDGGYEIRIYRVSEHKEKGHAHSHEDTELYSASAVKKQRHL